MTNSYTKPFPIVYTINIFSTSQYVKYGLLVFLFNLLIVSDYLQAQSFEHPGGLHSKSLLNSVREKITEEEEPWMSAYSALMIQAKENIIRTPEPVEDFNVPGYYDDPDGHREAMDRLSLDAWTAYVCAIAYQVSPQDSSERYAEKALEVINLWAEVNKKTSNFDGNLAMTDAGVGLVLAAELMTDYAGWETTQRDTFINWLKIY